MSSTKSLRSSSGFVLCSRIGDFLHKVNTVSTANIVLMGGIGEIVQLHAGLDAGLNKTQAVLPYDSVVYGTLTNQQFAFQVFGAWNQAGALKSFRVGSLSLHIALSVHDLIPFPVYYRSSGHTHLEYFRIAERGVRFLLARCSN